MKAVKKALAALCCLMLLLPALSALADDSFNMNRDGFSTSYTYGYDYWGDVQESPDAYRVSAVFDFKKLGLEDNPKEKKPVKAQSMFVRNDDLYIVDRDNNRILQVKCGEESYTLTRVIDTVNGCELSTFKTPYDVYVDADDNIYVADYGNFRVVMMDKDLNWIKEFVKPTDSTFDQSKDFLPKKIVVDVAGRLYVLATNIYNGIVKYEADGTFTGYIGANKVSVNMADYIWKKYFQTQAQRDASAAFVPTEYANVYIDKDCFIYATTTNFSQYDLKSNVARPIRRLNGLGNDILIRNDRYPPIGDLWWLESDNTGAYGPSKMVDITVLDNEIYVALDTTRGRLFGYDNQGVMLWAFGTKGNIDGAFMNAISIEHRGLDLFVLDESGGRVTVFTPTEYGMLIYNAIEKYQEGKYDESAAIWQEVLKHNSNYPLAFRGIGRAVLRQDKFEEAMEYFKMAHDRENYGRAFKLYRKEWIEKNILWVFLVVLALVAVLLTLGRIKKMKWEVMAHEYSKVRKNIG